MAIWPDRVDNRGLRVRLLGREALPREARLLTQMSSSSVWSELREKAFRRRGA